MSDQILSARSLTLSDVIEHYLVFSDPHVLTAHDRLHMPVTWVHSSEIFEIGPLLAGGELLLTTGLGLAGLDAGTRRHYVRDLAQRGVAALAFELGRTFDAVPDEMISEGSVAHLPIIELRRVVPFIEVCRATNTAIVSDEVDDLRARAELDAALHEELAAGGGVAATLARLSESLDAPLVLLGNDGALLAVHGVNDDRAAWRMVDAAVAARPIRIRDRVLGRIIAGPSRSGSAPERAALLLEVAAGPLGLALTRSGGGGSAVGARLVAELLESRPMRRADLFARLAMSGLAVGDSAVLVAVAAEAPDHRVAESALQSAGTTTGGVVVAAVNATVFGLVLVADGGVGDVDAVERVRDALSAAAGRTGRFTAVVGGARAVVGADAGPALAHALTDSLRACSESLSIALCTRGLPGGGRSVFTGRELAVDVVARTLDAHVGTELRSLAAPLAEYDRSASTQLVHTLDMHLRHGCSATRSSRALHIGRQSLYQRLDRIRGLLGFDPTSAEVYASMLLSLSVIRNESR